MGAPQAGCLAKPLRVGTARTTTQSVGTVPFGACGDNTESKISSFRARVGLCAVVEDRLSFRRAGGRTRGCQVDVVTNLGLRDRSCWRGLARTGQNVREQMTPDAHRLRTARPGRAQALSTFVLVSQSKTSLVTTIERTFGVAIAASETVCSTVPANECLMGHLMAGSKSAD